MKRRNPSSSSKTQPAKKSKSISNIFRKRQRTQIKSGTYRKINHIAKLSHSTDEDESPNDSPTPPVGSPDPSQAPSNASTSVIDLVTDDEASNNDNQATSKAEKKKAIC